MTGATFTTGDGSTVALQLDAGAGKITVTYAPAAEPLAYTASLRATTPALRDSLNEICGAGALPDATRPAEMNVRLARFPARAAVAAKIVGRRIQHLLEWMLASKENTNFTYDLTPLNRAHLAAMVSVVTTRPASEIEAYLREPSEDAALAAHYSDAVAQLRPDLAASADAVARWSRRLGWYAIVRALKPRCVVETGVDKGHGSLVLCAALRRNAAEGHVGRYIGTDINPSAGYLLKGAYAQHGEIVIGDSIESLKKLSQPIDVFINDSDHSADYEYNEYQTIKALLHTGSIVIGDNSHVTDKLIHFAAETGRRFLFFREEPTEHWYPGAGIGFAFT